MYSLVTKQKKIHGFVLDDEEKTILHVLKKKLHALIPNGRDYKSKTFELISFIVEISIFYHCMHMHVILILGCGLYQWTIYCRRQAFLCNKTIRVICIFHFQTKIELIFIYNFNNN